MQRSSVDHLVVGGGRSAAQTFSEGGDIREALGRLNRERSCESLE
jgi:hypothetical protein